MELDQQFVIPTASRAKISHKLSYPVGAERVSVVLVSVPQLPELKLHFYSGFDVQLRGGHYEFLRVEYLNNARPSQEWPISSLYKRPEQGRWEIVVQPVPRALRHRVKQYILGSALTQIAQWLIQRKELAQQGNDILAFFYDEKGEDFVSRHLTRLEPLR
jgi:hypothetical protein